jgi:hypothetical protein
MEALIQTAATHPEAGAVGGKVLHPDGRLQNAGMILWRDAHTSPPWAGEAPPPTAFDRLRSVDYCGSSSLLVRTGAWDTVGGLDERFYPVYYVDVDLSMSLRRLGFVVLYQPASRIRHHQGASRDLRFRAFALQRNRQMFIEKWAEALEEHEPPARGSREAIERAMVRAEARAEQSRGRSPRTVAPRPARQAFDVTVQEQHSHQRSTAFLNAYVGHLTDALAEIEHELARLRARLEPDYFIGDEIDFGDPTMSRRFLVGGWGETEPWGVWTIGHRADLKLLLKADPGGPFILKALVCAFVTEVHPRICVRVSADGLEITEWSFDLNDQHADRPRWCNATIPACTDNQRESPLEISFVIDAPVSPLTLGLSADPRILGLGLSKLTATVVQNTLQPLGDDIVDDSGDRRPRPAGA